MSNEKALTIKYESDHGEVKLSPGIIKKYLVSGRGRVSDQELIMFMKLCQYQRLNPFLRDAYLIKYTDNEPATMVTGKDTFTKRAEKNEKYDGFEAGIYVAKDGKIEKRTGSMHINGEEIVGGWARVHRKDRSVPVEVSVSMDEYMGRKKDGTPNRQWSRMPGTMIRKVALVQALREAFPADFQGLYDSAEMSHIDGAQLEEESPIQPVQEEVEDVEYTEETTDEDLDEAAERGWEEAAPEEKKEQEKKTKKDPPKQAEKKGETVDAVPSIGKSDGPGLDIF